MGRGAQLPGPQLPSRHSARVIARCSTTRVVPSPESWASPRSPAAAYPDDTAFDPTDKHYDPKSDPSDPTWYMPDVKFVSRLPRVVTLHELQGRPELEGLLLTRKGNRLSVMPASKAHFDFIVRLARARLDRERQRSSRVHRCRFTTGHSLAMIEK